MPSLRWNRATWGRKYDWSQRGEEWSATWGGSTAQWYGSLYPRIWRFLPAVRVLEIAPGHGRWTRFLIANSDELLGIDLAEDCVEYCTANFGSETVRFVRNDGVSLEAARDGSIDFAFSFDSLVHAELEVLEAYVPQLVAKLAPGGAAFLHHSNFRACGSRGDNRHNRAESVDARAVADLVRAAGGRVLLQELVNWGGDTLSDCFTLFARRADGAEPAPHAVLENPRFMDEARAIRDFVSPYARIQLR